MEIKFMNFRDAMGLLNIFMIIVSWKDGTNIFFWVYLILDKIINIFGLYLLYSSCLRENVLYTDAQYFRRNLLFRIEPMTLRLIIQATLGAITYFWNENYDN
jgi:hypothetical protein